MFSALSVCGKPRNRLDLRRSTLTSRASLAALTRRSLRNHRLEAHSALPDRARGPRTGDVIVYKTVPNVIEINLVVQRGLLHEWQ